MTRHDVVDNVKKLTFTPAELQSLLADFSRAIVLVAYQKYRQDEHDGLIPKIQVDVIRHTARTFEQFRSAVVRSPSAEVPYCDRVSGDGICQPEECQ